MVVIRAKLRTCTSN